MIDIHSHILPGVDDGSKDFTTSLEMLKRAQKDGTKKIIATPHYCIDYAEIPYNKIKELVEQFRKEVKSENLDIEIYCGQEVYFSENMVNDYKQGIIGTINNSRYMLFEVPMRNFDESTFDIIYELQVAGVVPILAHPERYKPIIENPSMINRFIEEGVLLQINAGSIEGKFGKSVRKTAEILLQNNLYNFIGSDAHNLQSRSTGLSESIELINKINRNADKLFNESSICMLNNEEIEFDGEKIKTKKSIFSFLGKK